MKKKLIENYIYNLMYQLLAIIVPLITTPYISRILGASNIGANSYVAGIVSYFGLAAMTGTASFGQREIAKRQKKKNEKEKIFWDVFYFRFFCTIVVWIIYIIFIHFFVQRYVVLYYIYMLSFLSWIFDISWYFQGIENFKITAIRNGIVKIIATILIFVLVKNSNDLWIYSLIYVVSTLIGNLTMIPALSREINFNRIHISNVFSKAYGIFSLFLPVIAIQIYTVLNQTMLGFWSTTTQVGYYYQANQIINLLMAILTSFTAVLGPRIAFLYGEKKFAEIREYAYRSISLLYFLSLPMYAGCILVSKSFVPIFFGFGYAPVANIMNILSLLFVFLGMGQITGSFLISLERQKVYTIAVTVTAIVNFTLNYVVLTNFHGSAQDVASITVLSEFICTGIQLWGLKDIFDITKTLKDFIKYGSISMCMLFFVQYATIPVADNKLIYIFAQIIAGGVFYFGVLILMRDRNLNSLLISIKRKL